MDFQNIETETRDGVAILYLNRPESRNAISVAMRREISACLGRWKEDREVGVVERIGVVVRCRHVGIGSSPAIGRVVSRCGGRYPPERE